MFAQTWRSHWGLIQDPFDCEDADKDLILARLDTGAVHAGFDRLFGNPAAPAPGVVFGEKGSGKSGLRLMMRRRIEEHNAEVEEQDSSATGAVGRVFLVEYTDFDYFFEQFRRAVGGGAKAAKVLTRWKLADHVDAMLSLTVTQLVDATLEAKRVPSALTRKQRFDLRVLTALYYHSKSRTRTEAVAGVQHLAGPPSLRRGWLGFLRLAGTALGLGLPLARYFTDEAPGTQEDWVIGGLTLLTVTWLWTFVSTQLVHLQARRAVRNVRVLPPESDALARVLAQLAPGLRKEFALPDDKDEGLRYDLLDRVQGLLVTFGYDALYVLVDRVDEPSFLGADTAAMRSFCERLLDHKLLQHPGLALKLFLPIELDVIHRNASAEELKRMRLDKSNLVPELKWSGLELYDIANRRLAASNRVGEQPRELSEFFASDLDPAHVRDALDRLATPRYTFGFLSALFQDHIRVLPDGLEPDAEAWAISRAHFDLVSSVWIEKAQLLRRTLN